MRSVVALLALVVASGAYAAEPAQSRKIVLIAGDKSHGPGAHDYERTMRLFKVMLDNSNVADRVRVEVHEKGWPADEKTLDDADSIVFYSDGRDGDLYADAPFVVGDRMKTLQKQVDRGCGIMTMHFSTFVTDQQGEKILDWVGGYFDWQDDAGQRNWYSKISQVETLELATRDHPISRGVPRMIPLRDEVYWKLRFREGDKRITPIWRALDVKDEVAAPHLSTVGWATQREDGGRGFGTSVGHGYRLWQDDGIRKLFLNAIVWTARAEVPPAGVEAKFYTDEQVNAALQGNRGTSRAIVEAPLKVLLFTGNAAHAWHNGEKSTPAVVAALQADRRIEVEVSREIEDLGRKNLADYSAIVLNNYCNWHDPKGLSERSQQAFVDYLKQGGGLAVVHFANGAFHYSLPEAKASDWPEYRKIVRRVWDHEGKGDQQSAHDPFGPFQVEIAAAEHPIVAGLKPFQVTDELYFHQAGTEPIEPIIVASAKGTGKAEPLAWTYNYHKARVFQTLLGHSEKTYEAYEAREMLRRGVAWAARRKIVPVAQENDRPAVVDPAIELVEGRFGKALNAKAQGVLLAEQAVPTDTPLSVQCWAKLENKQNFNILVASEEKSSPTHWELYSYAGSGLCSVYLPGQGGEFKTTVDIADGHWHHVGFTLSVDRVQIFVDGKKLLDQPLKKSEATPPGGAIAVGRLVEGNLGCQGRIDDLRITSGALELTDLPKEPLARQRDTRLLLAFDDVAELSQYLPRRPQPAQGAKNAAVPRPTVSVSKGAHWGLEGIGFNWKEEDSRDDRWKNADIGPFLASSLPLGSAAGTVSKGLSVRLGDAHEATVCYDTANLKLRSAWTGGFLKFTAARYGLISPPLMDGEPQFLAAEGPGWAAKSLHYRGLQRAGKRVILSYEVDGVRVEETPWAEQRGENTVVTRRFEIAPSATAMTMNLAAQLGDGDSFELREMGAMRIAVFKSGDHRSFFATRHPAARWQVVDRALQLVVPPHAKADALSLAMGTLNDTSLEQAAEVLEATDQWGSLAELKQRDTPLWTAEITTRGKVAADEAPYVVDTITIPFENPYRALFFTSGHDFIDTDTVAVCTVHGDVWLVTGVDDKLARLRWKRFATGLFQPLGIVAKGKQLYVLGRDQITRLQDKNGDGEAEVYECFTNRMPTSAGGHDYTACLETDAAGNFYFLTAQQGIWRLSPDGQTLVNLAGGLRNPNGLGVGPGPIVTASPQEGNWTPATYIAEAKPGDYFGFGGPQVTPERPLGWTQPLCFIPRRRDNSSGGQVWATSDRWGPLANQMFHFSYGQCRMMLVLREVIEGQAQGGTVDMTPLFESGAMRGRFSPHDGQLYVSGLRGWTTAATQDGCLQRVRYTGEPVHMPTRFRTLQNGVAITFAEPLQRNAAEEVGNYHLEQWNYRYRESYGSPDFKVSDPKQEGHDVVRVESATLLDDGRTVFLEIPELQPVNQLTVGYALTGADGEEFRHTIAYTIHKLGSERMDPIQLHRSSVAGRLTEAQEASLRPGLATQWGGGDNTAHTVSRMASLRVTGAAALSQRVTLRGYLNATLKGDYQFAAHGEGSLRMLLNGREVFAANGDLAAMPPAKAALHSGYNELQIEYEAAPQPGEQTFRLLWSSGADAFDPIPPTALFHAGNDPAFLEPNQLALGAQLVANRHCAKCHAGESKNWPQGIRQPPSLAHAGARLNPDWIAHWLLNPAGMSNSVTMPHSFDPEQPADRQAAAHVAAYLATWQGNSGAAAKPTATSDEVLATGRELYENLGCIACHKLTEPAAHDEFQRLSLHYVNAKYRDGELHAYLLAPHRHHATGRMPDFRLNNEEAAALAAYLHSAAEGKVAPLPENKLADAALGEREFQQRRCGACHSEPKPRGSEVVAATPIRRVAQGCLAENAGERGTAPVHAWSPGEREAVVAYLSAPAKVARIGAAALAARSLFAELRCDACHKRDGEQALRMAVLTEESESGLTPELLPDLTWAGEKLHRSWAEQQIAGKIDARVRPWLKARMPAFPAYAAALAAQIEAEHGLGSTPHEAEIQPELARIGEQLTLKENLDCRQCHGMGDLEPMGDEKTKLAPGINFGFAKDRLRRDYYHRFVLDPPRWDISTRMPKLAVDGRTTKVTKFYQGDAAQQFEAIWHYLQTVPPPSR